MTVVGMWLCHNTHKIDELPKPLKTWRARQDSNLLSLPSGAARTNSDLHLNEDILQLNHRYPTPTTQWHQW